MFIVQVLCLDYILHLTRRSWFAQHKTGRGTRDPEDLGIGNRSLLGLGELGGGTEMSSQDLLLINFVWLWGKTFFYPLWRFSVKLLTHCYLKCGFDFGGLSVTSRLKPGQNRGHLLGQPHPGSSSVRRRWAFSRLVLSVVFRALSLAQGIQRWLRFTKQTFREYQLD